MELLITGATGFVGRNLLLKVTDDARWSRIILPVRDPEKLRSQLLDEGILADHRLVICRVEGDVWGLPADVRPDLMIHAAGLLFGRRREDYFRTNVEGSLRLAAQLHAGGRMIVLSSLAAGGPTPFGADARGEHHEDAPISWYGRSKLAMEGELLKLLGPRLLVLRPPMVLGPRDAATLPLFQMAKGAVRMKTGLSPKHYSWIDAGELCDAILAAATMDWPQAVKDGNGDWNGKGNGPGRRCFYIAGEGTITDSQLLATAAGSLGRRGMTIPVPEFFIRLASLIVDCVPSWRKAVPSLGRDRVLELFPSRWVSDGGAFAENFGWRACRHLGETLGETERWLRAQGKI